MLITDPQDLMLTGAQFERLDRYAAERPEAKVVGYDFMHGRISPHIQPRPNSSAVMRVKPDGRAVSVPPRR